MAKKIRLDVVTPEKVAFSKEVNMVIARTTAGDVGILPGHAPLVGTLGIWPLRIMEEEGETQLSLMGGFIEVQPDKITILGGTVELVEEIDVARAEAAKERAQRRLKGDVVAADTVTDELRAEIALKRAIVRLKVCEFYQQRRR